jgi:hypothetical protein
LLPREGERGKIWSIANAGDSQGNRVQGVAKYGEENIHILNEKIAFLPSKYFKLLSEMKGNSFKK